MGYFGIMQGISLKPVIISWGCAVDENEKQLYKMLAEWEMGHQKMLHELNEELKADVWNDNNFWPF